jgi:hypothetical protein
LEVEHEKEEEEERGKCEKMRKEEKKIENRKVKCVHIYR